MANFFDNFSGDLSNWIRSSAAPINRFWYTESGLLKVQDNVSGKEGLIRYKDPIDVNGTITVEYNGLDLYNGTDNLIVLRYTDDSNFNFITIQPGQNDDRGVGFGYDDIYQSNDMNVPLVNSNGVLLSSEIAPNKTIIPQTGTIEITFEGNEYDIVLWDSVSSFVASGTYVDTLNKNINSGYVGFAHTIKWDSNIVGYDSINVADTSASPVPPTITSFSAVDYNINLGESTDIGWAVTSGTDTTLVYLDGSGYVDLYGTSSVSPIEDTEYVLSAWNSGGMGVEQFTITVADTFPIITVFDNNGPISAGEQATLTWSIVSGTAVGALITPDIGFVDPVSGSVNTPVLYNDTIYTLIAFDGDGDSDGAFTQVEVEQPPSVSLQISGTPVCSGSPYYLIWDSTEATSVYIDNGIGSVSLDGSLEVSSTGPVNYNISAMNSLGTATDSANAIVYYRDPIPYVGDDQYLTSFDGNPVSATLDGSFSYDPDGMNITYEWYEGSTLISNEATFTKAFDVGSTTVTLVVTDECSQSASDDLIINVNSIIPPVAIADADRTILTTSGTVTLDGSQSYDPDGTITDYEWYYNGSVIGSTVQHQVIIDVEGSYTYYLVVRDDDNFTASDSVTITYTKLANPVADAGGDQTFCITSGVEVFFDGSNSYAPLGTSLTAFSWDFTDINGTTVSGTVDENPDISASVFIDTSGSYVPTLTVYSDVGEGSDSVRVDVYNRPIVSASNVYETLDYGEGIKLVTLSAFANASDPEYVWKIYQGPNEPPIISNEQFPSIYLTNGSYTADVYVSDLGGTCISDIETIDVVVSPYGLEIIDFSLDPYQEIIVDGDTFVVNVNWIVSGATNVTIDNGIGSVNPISGTTPHVINSPGGFIDFTITATDGVNSLIETITGFYNFIRKPELPNEFETITICKDRLDRVRTYGLDELKYGTDRDINLVNYLPDYIRDSQTEVLLERFEYYLNHMFNDQGNYTWGEDSVEVTVCDTSDCKQLTCCDDRFGCSGSCSAIGDCGNDCVGEITNTYSFEGVTSAGIESILAPTPSESVGELIISDMCQIKTDKISILDKVFRLTELFDPDLIPIDLIQFYAENLGYSAGINRESLGNINIDKDAQELEQRRYLRFMVRNLPNWYQIKTNRSSIKIMMYSFGLIGDFVYYYTKNYSDRYSTDDLGITVGDGGITFNSGDKDKYEIALNRCALKPYLNDINAWTSATNSSNGLDNNDWILSNVDKTSLEEDLSPIPESEGYYSTPHFKLWVDILGSTGDYSQDEERQRMIKTAVDAVKPINTVFDGVAVYWEGTPVMMYQRPIQRLRKSIKIISDGTYTS